MSLLNWSLVAGMAVLLTSADQSAVPSPQQTPIFRAQADLVLLDVRVLDKDRRPIRGLSADEFSIFEDGKPQKLANFAEIAVPGVEPPRSVWSNETPLDVSTNEQPVARVWAFVIDDALIPMDPRIMRDTKALVRGLIERIGPSDQASVIFTADSRQAQPFTSDKARLLASMDKFAPGLASWGGSLNLDAQFHLGAVNTLRFVVEALEGIRNVKKSIVWVTPGIPANIEAALPQLITGGQAGTRDAQLRLLDLTKDLFRTARKANIPIYPIDPCGLDGLKLFITKGQVVRDQLNAPWVRSEDYMLAAAAETGGKAFIKSNDMLPAIDRLFIENDAYYLLAYVPSDASKARVSRRLEVKVQRSGLDVLTRTEVAPSPSRPRASAQQAAADALASPIPVGDLPMRVTAAPFAIPGGRNGVVLLVLGIREPIVSPSDQRINVNTEIRTAAYTMEGALRDGRKHTATVTLRPGSKGEAEYEGLSRLDLPPGRYQLRVTAHSVSSGKTGGALIDVTVPDFGRDAASLSGLVLTESPSLPSAPKKMFDDVLPVTPTARRRFSHGSAVTAHALLYQARGPHPARMDTVIVDEAGQTVASATQEVSASQFVRATKGQSVAPETHDSSRPTVGVPQERRDPFANTGTLAAPFEYALPMARLPPGTYRLTVAYRVGETLVQRHVVIEIQ